jgi:hypothetical protein
MSTLPTAATIILWFMDGGLGQATIRKIPDSQLKKSLAGEDLSLLMVAAPRSLNRKTVFSIVPPVGPVLYDMRRIA